MLSKTKLSSCKPVRSNHRTRKSTRIEKKSGDKFSDLHIDLKHLILRHLSTYEIARLSVLSTKWRRVIYSHPTLNFDESSCFIHLLNNRYFTPSDSRVEEYLKLILHIVSNHTGLLDKFSMYIPYEYKLTNIRYQSLVQQIVSALPKSIQYLHVKNDGDGVCPLSIRGFEELTHLKLNRCSLESQQPKTLLLFPKLTKLDLRQMSIPVDLGQSLSCIAPRLERLHLHSCCTPYYLCKCKIDVSSVTELFLDNCLPDVLFSTKDSKLTSFAISLNTYIRDDELLLQRVNGYCLQLHKLTRLEIFNAYTLKMLCFCLNNIEVEDGTSWAMEKLIIYGVYLVSCLNELLIRAKNVRELWIEDSTPHDSIDGLKGVTLDRLTTLSFKTTWEQRDDFPLLKSLLGCSPVLEKLNIGVSQWMDPRERRNVKKIISELRKRSPGVEVKYF